MDEQRAHPEYTRIIGLTPRTGYSWSADESEWATDVLFRSAAAVEDTLTKEGTQAITGEAGGRRINSDSQTVAGGHEVPRPPRVWGNKEHPRKLQSSERRSERQRIGRRGLPASLASLAAGGA